MKHRQTVLFLQPQEPDFDLYMRFLLRFEHLIVFMTEVNGIVRWYNMLQAFLIRPKTKWKNQNYSEIILFIALKLSAHPRYSESILTR
nr:PREDICTED: uncharacterized protein LOC105662502 isoform X2 [Megachile rotundata]